MRHSEIPDDLNDLADRTVRRDSRHENVLRLSDEANSTVSPNGLRLANATNNEDRLGWENEAYCVALRSA